MMGLMLFASPLSAPSTWLTKPGLFITGTDTGVGKTVVTCAIACALRQQLRLSLGRPPEVGVCKPMASGCLKEREGLVSEDAMALAYFADSDQPLSVINPVRYAAPLSPAAAAQATGQAVDFDAIARSLSTLDQASDVMLVEGVGGLMVPIDHQNPKLTLLDLAIELGYPVLVVCRALLGTLNHTAMTVALLRQAGCRLAGLVVNGYQADASLADATTDLSMSSNRHWLTQMTDLPILATIPTVPGDPLRLNPAKLPGDILQAILMTDWVSILAKPEPIAGLSP